MSKILFQVVEEPYCLWEENLNAQTMSFLAGIDTGYFDHLLKLYLDSEDEERAAMALRVAFHHAMETLFSFLGALLQAPAAPQAWIAKCQNSQLKELVRRISDCDNNLPRGLSLQSVSWTELARATLCWYRSGTERQSESIKLFAEFWRRLAAEFLDQNRIDEYNSLKHGFRVTGGGYGLSVGLEHEYGVQPPENEMQSILQSEFGTSFWRFLNASGKRGERSLVSEQVFVNWKIEKVAPLLQITSISIANVVGALKVLNGELCNIVKFDRPESDEAFVEPWKQVPPSNNLVISAHQGADVPFLSKEELLAMLEANG